jgi:D-arabinose 1-dehydrogenase-like Zn-dependent alcohol dehydrogenase
MVERPLPLPGAGEARVRIEASGVCGSDIFLQDGGFGAEKLPVVPGHEAAGVVDAVGPNVTQVRPGDQVAIYYIDSPRDSRYARAGRPNIGPGLRRMGVDVDGAFAEYVVRRQDLLIVPPAHIDPSTLAVLTDAVATPWHALARIARLQPGETLVVLGIGGVGSNAVQIGKHLEARVIAVSRSEARLQLAAELGADHLVRSADQTVDEVRRLCGGDGADVVVQCAGSAALDELALAIAGFGGRVVSVGSSTQPFTARSVDFIWRELSLLGSRGFTPQDIRDVIGLFLDGDLRTDHLTRRIRPLEEVNDALADLRSGAVLRSILVP